jgi:NTP pyrophosphatase (non-canonical NTP hydrolase)
MVQEEVKMQFYEYQKKAANLNMCPKQWKLIHAVLGLAGESGEVCEKFKKIYRDKNGEMSNEFREDIEKEMGDILWYVADVCTLLGISLDDVATTNIAKLESRKQRGVLTGSGDNR